MQHFPTEITPFETDPVDMHARWAKRAAEAIYSEPEVRVRLHILADHGQYEELAAFVLDLATGG